MTFEKDEKISDQVLEVSSMQKVLFSGRCIINDVNLECLLRVSANWNIAVLSREVAAYVKSQLDDDNVIDYHTAAV